MNAKQILAIASIAAAGLLAAPAMAGSLVDSSTRDFDESRILAELHYKGIDATSVERWGSGHYVATVRVNGMQSLVFLDPDSLAILPR